MKAFLLAAGVGSRLRPLTDTIPKCMVPIRGKPLIEIWFDLLRRSGITEVLVNSHAHSDKVCKFAHDRLADFKWILVEESHLLGSAGTLAANRDWVEGADCFWILYADVLTNVNLCDMLQFHKHHPSAATMGVYRVRNPSQCGIAIVDQSNRIERFVEKPECPPDNLAFSGIMIGTSVLLDAIPPKRPADLGFDVLPRLAGQMFAYSIRDYLMDIGTMENYERAQSSWPGL